MWVVVKPLLSILSGPVGRYALIGLAFLAWSAYQRADATADCQDDHLREELAESNRQLGIAQGIAAEARTRADGAQAAITELEGLAHELSTEIRESGDGCTLDPDIAERLRGLR